MYLFLSENGPGMPFFGYCPFFNGVAVGLGGSDTLLVTIEP